MVYYIHKQGEAETLPPEKRGIPPKTDIMEHIRSAERK